MHTFCTCIAAIYFWKITVFWDVASCILVYIARRLRRDYCPHHQSDDEFVLMMEAVSSSETLVKLYETAWYIITEDGHLYTRLCENVLFDSNNIRDTGCFQL
jgi:hypothetical protein